MSESTEIAEQNAELPAELAEAEAALAQTAVAGIDTADLSLPLLKLSQQSTREVSNGDLESGVYFNSVTADDYGETVDLIVVHAFKGRLYVDEDDRTFVASGPVAPSDWPEEYAGKRFVDIPDAEETFKANANSGVHEWGRGPKIQTTYNFVGFLPDAPELPVRLSLKSTATKTAQKFNLLLRTAGAPWSKVFQLGVDRQEKNRKAYYVPTVRVARQSTVEERSAGVRLAQQVQAAQEQIEARFADAGEAEAPAAPEKPADALDV